MVIFWTLVIESNSWLLNFNSKLVTSTIGWCKKARCILVRREIIQSQNIILRLGTDMKNAITMISFRWSKSAYFGKIYSTVRFTPESDSELFFFVKFAFVSSNKEKYFFFLIQIELFRNYVIEGNFFLKRGAKQIKFVW